MRFLCFIGITVPVSCCSQKNIYTRLEGHVFGTYYSIHYKSVEDYREEIENLMEEYSKGVSKYDPQSEISDFNREGKVTFRSPYLREMFLKAREMYDISTGALDPTLMPSLGVWYCKAC